MRESASASASSVSTKALRQSRSRRHRLSPPSSASAGASWRVGTRWCHSTRSWMNETPWPLNVLAMTQVGCRLRAGAGTPEQARCRGHRPRRRPSRRRATFRQGLEAHRVFRRVALLEPVAIDDDSQVVEPEVDGGHDGFPVAALLEFTIAREDEGAALGAVHLRRKRDADGDRQAVAERPGIGLDAGHLVAIGVAVQPRQWLMYVRAARAGRSRPRPASRRGRRAWPLLRTKRSREGSSGCVASMRSAWKKSVARISAQDKSPPGCPIFRGVHHPQAGEADAPRPVGEARHYWRINMHAFFFMRHAGNLPVARRLVNCRDADYADRRPKSARAAGRGHARPA